MTLSGEQPLTHATGSLSGGDNDEGKTTWLIPLHFRHSVLCIETSSLLSPSPALPRGAPFPKHDPHFAKEHPTHPQSQEILFVLLNLLYFSGAKRSVFVLFFTSPNMGSISDSPWRSILRPYLHTIRSPQKGTGPQPSQVIKQPATFLCPQ